MKIAIVGAGAVGGYFGGRLVQAGHDVIFLSRGETLDKLQRVGLRIESPRGDAVIPVRAVKHPEDAGPVDAVLLCVKAWQVPSLAADLGPLLGPDTPVLPLQNGVEAPDQIAAAVGAAHALGGVARIISFQVAPAHVRHIAGEYIALGELDGRLTPRCERLRDALAGSGIAAEMPPRIQAAMWEKFQFVVAWGALGALSRVPIGVIRSVPETRALLLQAAQEIEQLAAARGIALDTAKTLAALDNLPFEGTTSLQRDLAAGRASELESWSGAVVRLAATHALDVPFHRTAYACLKPLEERARGRLEF